VKKLEKKNTINNPSLNLADNVVENDAKRGQQCPAYGRLCHFQSECRLLPTKTVHVVMKEHSDDESNDPLYQLEVGIVNSRQGSFLQYCRFRKQWRRQSYSVNEIQVPPIMPWQYVTCVA